MVLVEKNQVKHVSYHMPYEAPFTCNMHTSPNRIFRYVSRMSKFSFISRGKAFVLLEPIIKESFDGAIRIILQCL